MLLDDRESLARGGGIHRRVMIIYQLGGGRKGRSEEVEGLIRVPVGSLGFFFWRGPFSMISSFDDMIPFGATRKVDLFCVFGWFVVGFRRGGGYYDENLTN